MIAFVGSVFSPYYAAARRRGIADPLDHCALNVALYGRGGRWAMTERRAAAVQRSADSLAIGPSRVTWDGDSLWIEVREIAVPLPRPVVGRVRVRPLALADRGFALDAAGRHLWQPIAPAARVEVTFDRPGLAWTGSGYVDSNFGSRPLEQDFARWSWARADREDGGAAVTYDVERRDGSRLGLALNFDRQARATPFAAPAETVLPLTGWRVERPVRSDPSHRPAVIRTLEDSPFYARSVVSARWDGQPVTAVHESLSLDRFDRRWVQALLPFRMPRTLR
ncbi:MAG: carotenoid 1,2-hydratase [Proteobacteria bacterium]|nr:carotenoid 1,2-hydratase [Pseudomonadota bacterium]